MIPLVIIGFNHNTAAIDFREQLAGGEEANWALMQQLKTCAVVSGSVILSTCNRFEIITTTEQVEQVFIAIARCKNIPLAELTQRSYCYEKEDALTHLLRVATGVDSMLLGEPQILGQLKMAYQHAHRAGFVDTALQRIFPEVFRVAKRVRHSTQINHNAVCTAYAVMCLAKSIFKLAGKRIVLIGSGEMIVKILAHCRDAQFGAITIANRTFEKAHELAVSAGVHAVPFSDIPHCVAQADIVVTAVQAPLAIIGKGLIERALKQRGHLPLLCVDLGMPRNIEPEVRDVSGVYLYNIDHMRGIVETGKEQRALAAEQATQILTTQAQALYQKMEALMAVDIVRDFRREVEMLRAEVYAEAAKALAQGNDAALVMQDALRKLSNKILHKPTVQLRRAVLAKREDVLQLTREFFDL